MRRTLALLILAACSLSALSEPARAPDASPPGVPVVVGEYDVPGQTGRPALRAATYRPATPAGRLPLVIVLHGNHSTCGRPYNPKPVGTDPPGLPCTRPTAGAACAEGTRYDYENYATLPRTCNSGLMEAKSYLGYEYLGRRLASQGYMVVSIDGNPINHLGNSGPTGDQFLILERGRLVLEHLEQLSAWNRNGGEPGASQVVQNGLDLEHIALVGHSRGGEAMRAAYNLYRAAASPWPARIVSPVTFDAIFEIGPTDFQGLNASGTAWTVLLPMCDADVSNLQGVRAFDRMMRDFSEFPPRPKSSYLAWGTNHNFYNTQWMISDTSGLRFTPTMGMEYYDYRPCFGSGNTALFPLAPGSAAQRLTALSSIPALIRGNVGEAPDRSLGQNFDTLFALPASVYGEDGIIAAYPTRTDRGFSPTANSNTIRVMEDFDRPTGTNTSGAANSSSGIVINHINGGTSPVPPGTLPRHDPSLRAAFIQWDAAGSGVTFQTNWTPLNVLGVDVRGYATLDLRVSRHADAVRNTTPTDFSIRLVGSNGPITRAVRLSSYAPVANDLVGPVGGGSLTNPHHPILQTYRILLTDFGNFAYVATQVRGVRFIFDQTPKGAIYMANIRFARPGESAPPPAELPSEPLPPMELPEQAREPAVAERNLGLPLPELDRKLAPKLSRLEPAPAPPAAVSEPVVYPGQVVRIQHQGSLQALDGASGVEIQVHSEINFLNRDEAIVLAIGNRQFTRSRYPGADTNNLVFTLSESEWAGISHGDTVRVHYGPQNGSQYWDFGTLDKSALVD
jgi:hypothetical protein